MGKDKNKPKGAMTAYSCFVQVIREEHKRKHPEEQVIFSEFSKKCAEKWKTMTPKEKKRFEDMAAVDKDRFHREMDDYTPGDIVGGKGLGGGGGSGASAGTNNRKRKLKKDPHMPKRALSAFFFFCEEERPAIRTQHPEWRVGDLAKELGHMWENCKNKEQYEQRAVEDKLRYEREMQQYKEGSFSGVTKRAAKDSSFGANITTDQGDDDEAEDEEDGDDGVDGDGDA